MKKKDIILAAVCLVLLVLLVALIIFMFRKDDDTPEKYVGKALTYETYKILEGHSGELKDYDRSTYVEGYKGTYDVAYYIEGKLVNTKNEKQDFVVIRFNLYDDDGKLLGEAIAGLSDVESQKEYDFKALSLTTTDDAKKVAKYELKSIQSK